MSGLAVIQFVVLCWGLGLSILQLLEPAPDGRARGIDFQMVALWLFLAAGWLK